jgi:hypothetical protein
MIQPFYLQKNSPMYHLELQHTFTMHKPRLSDTNWLYDFDGSFEIGY